MISLIVFGITCETTVEARDKVFKPKLADIVKGKGWRLVNRTVKVLEVKGKKGIHFDEREGVGIAWLADYEFKNGTIDFDVKGKNVLQKSFVGIAFQAADDEHYDAIYFRPFNFKSDDPDRRIHAVQYLASPNYGWKTLREEFPGKYEQPIEPAPDPDQWFHAQVVVEGKKVSVFVNHALRPSLVVEKLTESRAGKLGIWIGDNSDGDFANLIITSSN